MVIIALDYDGTYTAAPILWSAFVAMAKKQGHTVLCVTFRFNEPPSCSPSGMDESAAPRLSMTRLGVPVYFTCRQPKKKFMLDQAIKIDIWIDDQPQFIFCTEQQLKEQT